MTPRPCGPPGRRVAGRPLAARDRRARGRRTSTAVPRRPPAAGGARRSARADAVRRGPATGPTCCSSSAPRDMRSHAGQPAFPGGAIDPDGRRRRSRPRCARPREETGLDPAGVEVFGHAARALPAAERLRGHPGAGLVARAVAGAGRRPGRGRRGPPGAGRRLARPGEPVPRPRTRSGYSGPAFEVARAVGLGLHRRPARPAARSAAGSGRGTPATGLSRCPPTVLAGGGRAGDRPRPARRRARRYAVSGYRQGFVVGMLSLGGFLGGGAARDVARPALADGLAAGARAVVAVLVGVLVSPSSGSRRLPSFGGRLRADHVARRPSGRRRRWARWPARPRGCSCSLVRRRRAARRARAPVSRAVGASRVLLARSTASAGAGRPLFAGVPRGARADGSRGSSTASPRSGSPVPPPDPAVRRPGVRGAPRSVVKITGAPPPAAAARRAAASSSRRAGSDQRPRGRRRRRAEVQVGGVGPAYPAQVVLFDPQRTSPCSPCRPAAPRRSARPGLAPRRRRRGRRLPGGRPVPAPAPPGCATVIQAPARHLRPPARHPRGLLAVRPRRAGQLRRPAAVDPRRGRGVVFAKSLDDPTTGYALTIGEVAGDIRAGIAADGKASSGGCTSG